MPPAPVSNGCSQLRRLAPKWAAPILAKLTPGAPKSKSHNHCAGILVTSFLDALDLHLYVVKTLGNVSSGLRSPLFLSEINGPRQASRVDRNLDVSLRRR